MSQVFVQLVKSLVMLRALAVQVRSTSVVTAELLKSNSRQYITIADLTLQI